MRALRTLTCAFVAAAAVAFLAPACAPAFAATSTSSPVQVAQDDVTPLHMMGPGAQGCFKRCEQRASNCYRNARGERAKEDCEANEGPCKRNCR